jgi:BlaI family transcriptional regulator, penicillinase repressor
MPSVPPPLTRREVEIMAVLWDLGAATVAEVRERLQDRLAYTTILTTLRTLEAKGHLRHESLGRAFLYAPRTVRRDAAREAIHRLVSTMFHGSTEALIERILSDHELAPEQLRRLRDEIERRLARAGSTSASTPAPPQSRSLESIR